MPDLSSKDSVKARCAPSETITILHCHDNLRLTKCYDPQDGSIIEQGYGMAKHFQYTTHTASSLYDLYKLVKNHRLSPHTCLIRGVPVADLPVTVRRMGKNFPMAEGGARWGCLDIDGVNLPLGIDPYGPGGVEHVVGLLPPEFHSASYIAQFSASAGVLNPDGTPFKPGLRVHLFFWFDRPVTNEELKGWLFEYPVDNALFTSVQPHYIADPIFGSGVKCAVKERLYLEKKDSDVVQVPDLSEYRARIPSREQLGAEWEDPEDGLPSFDDLLTCEFIDWYLSNPHPDGERYEQTRAFAHNLRRVATDDWEGLLDQHIPSDFPYTDAIVSSADTSRPITCEHIYRGVYRCPRFNPETGTCRVNNHSKTPYSLALWIKRGS